MLYDSLQYIIIWFLFFEFRKNNIENIELTINKIKIIDRAFNDLQ